MIGIDLGTTNSCVAVMEGKVRAAFRFIFSDALGETRDRVRAASRAQTRTRDALGCGPPRQRRRRGMRKRIGVGGGWRRGGGEGVEAGMLKRVAPDRDPAARLGARDPRPSGWL